MKILAEVQRTDNRGFKCVNCPELSTKFAAYELEAMNESTFNQGVSADPVERGFDEVGREPIPAKYFGNDLNVMQYIFGIRYELRKLVKTHVTTNVRKESIPILYGDYIFDRLNEMFNFIEIKGESRRWSSENDITFTLDMQIVIKINDDEIVKIVSRWF